MSHSEEESCRCSECAIEIDSLTWRYPGQKENALEASKLRIRKNVLTAIIGPNGGGKTSLLQCLAGAFPHEGTVSVLGHRHCQGCRAVAYIPQFHQISTSYPITVQEVVLMGRDVHKSWPRKLDDEDYEIVANVLEEMHLTSLAQQDIQELSGGQFRRVFLARALAQQPELLLMDEPFSAVDPQNRLEVLSLLKERSRKGLTVVLVTHDLAEVTDFFDEVIVLRKKILAQGPPKEVLKSNALVEAFGGKL